MDRVAVVNVTEIISHGLPSFMLLFDKLAVPDFAYVRYASLAAEEEHKLMAEGRGREAGEEYLALGYYLRDAVDSAVRRGSNYSTHKQVMDNLSVLKEKGLLLGFKEQEHKGSYLSSAYDPWSNFMDLTSQDAHRIATALKINEGNDVSVQIIKSADSIIQATEMPNTFDRFEVANLIFKSLPIPNDHIPLDELISFKQDEEVKADLAKFRGWIAKMTKEHSSLADIEDEFLSIYYSYKKSVKRLDKKFSTTGWGLVTNVATEVADNLSQLKFGTALRALFDFRSAHLEYDEKLENVSGNQLSYIHRLENTFALKNK